MKARASSPWLAILTVEDLLLSCLERTRWLTRLSSTINMSSFLVVALPVLDGLGVDEGNPSGGVNKEGTWIPATRLRDSV